MNRQVVSISLLTSYIRELLETDELLSDMWVEGEVAETFVARSGHMYFTLRDTDCQLKCVMFRAQAQRLHAAPRAGDHIAAHGHISVYERDGAYQLYVDMIQPAGLGILALQLELLRQQLAAEGLFEPSRKRPIPPMPSCVGVVTSAEGAVWHDIQHVLRRRFPLVHLVLAPSPVQGDNAPAGIVAALQALQDDGRPEVIIVARGGGAVEDLWCFNDERVVRAVFSCRVPVVSGIGHETDWTLIDDVADLRAPTPSAAAELCSPSILELAAKIVDLQRQLTRVHADQMEALRDAVSRLTSRAARQNPARSIADEQAKIADLDGRLSGVRFQVLNVPRAQIVDCRTSIHSSVKYRLGDELRELKIEQARLLALNPADVLRRGYAHLTLGDDGRVVNGVGDVAVRDKIVARLEDGIIVGSVIGTARLDLTSTRTTDDGS